MPTIRTRTVKASGGDYTSLSAWEAGEQGDLPTLDEIRQAECYAMVDTTAVTIDGWTTDATRYIRIYAALGCEAGAPYRSSGAYSLEMTNQPGIISIGENYVRIERIQLKVTSTGSGSVRCINTLAASISAAVGEIQIIGCTLVGVLSSTSTTQSSCIFRTISGGAIKYIAANNVFYDFTSSAAAQGVCLETAMANGITGEMHFLNNTMYNCFRGVHSASGTNAPSNVRLKNNGFDSNGVASADGYLAVTGTWHPDSDYNASDLADDAPGPYARNSVSPAFVNESARDLHLLPTDTAWKDRGTNLASDSGFAFNDDFDGRVRLDWWDIGADEFSEFGDDDAPRLGQMRYDSHVTVF